MVIKIRLVDAHCICPLGNGQTHIHGCYPRKLTHSIHQQGMHYPVSPTQVSAATPARHSTNRIPSRIPMKALLMKLRSTYYRIKHPEITYTHTQEKPHLRLWFSVFSTGMSILHANHCPKFYLSMSIICQTLPDYESLYCCLLMDFVTGVIIDVLPDRKKSYLLYYLSHIKHESYSYETHTSELDCIQYVSIDMSESFRSVFQSYCPKAIICADSFHVLQHLTKDFNAVRLKCRRETPDPVLAYLLMKFKVVLNHNVQLDNVARYNKRLKRYINLRGIQTVLFKHFPELKS